MIQSFKPPKHHHVRCCFFYNYICHTRASPAEPASPASRAGFAARRAERSVVWPMAAGSPCLLAGQRRRLETCRSRRGCWHVVTRKNRSKSHRFEIERFGPVATYPPQLAKGRFRPKSGHRRTGLCWPSQTMGSRPGR